jgi:RNA polymerase sigma factor (TIGR02999 family)
MGREMGGRQEQVTQILRAVESGSPGAASELLPLVYDELRGLARRQMAQGPAGQTLQPTALVHEAYLRLVGNEGLRWRSRAHFYAVAALAMRQILVDRARRRSAAKRGGDRVRVSLEQVDPAAGELPAEQFLALDAALERLDGADHQKAQVVMLRYFAGLTIPETARSLDVSPATVKREWQFAKAWLYREMTRDD